MTDSRRMTDEQNARLMYILDKFGDVNSARQVEATERDVARAKLDTIKAIAYIFGADTSKDYE